jgi:phosphoribosylformylglycinamidine cyclo-ligase
MAIMDPYKAAGVDVDQGDALADWLASDKGHAQFVHPRGLGRVDSGIGGFAGIFSTQFSKFKSPQLVASTDGVGTKLLLGLQQDRISGLGQDLVAMCVNDLYTVGAAPLFFLDYFATGALSSEQFKKILQSIKESCQTCDMALLGGETAEMPGLYAKGHFDLAGFVVGVVDADDKLGPDKTKAGDVLVAFESTGFHSNGYSLIRKWLQERPELLTTELVDFLLTPTRLYPEVLTLKAELGTGFHALANITGGGISGNLPRVIHDDLVAVIDRGQVFTPEWINQFIKQFVKDKWAVESVFNLGVGMISVVDASVADRFIEMSSQLGLKANKIGSLEARGSEKAPVIFR